MHCSLFIPDFFSTEIASPANRLAAAETLFARGRRKHKASISPEAWLFERFGVRAQRGWPAAPYTLLADGGAPEGHFWMRADPVHLSIARDDLAFDGAALDVSRSEAESLAGTLNRHFGDAPAFHPLRPERWYIRLPDAPQLDTTPPSAARRTAIGDKLPSGADAMRFRALMNEVQMLLHEHPVNTEREARGAPAVNSVWFWGGGTLLEAPGARPFSIVLAEDPLARGLALAAGIRARHLPENAATLLSILAAEGVALVVLDSLRSDALERDWLVPLLGALEDGRIGMLSLTLSGTDSLLEVETVRSDLRYFWRTRKPLQSYLA
jgi:hypothetical protein